MMNCNELTHSQTCEVALLLSNNFFWKIRNFGTLGSLRYSCESDFGELRPYSVFYYVLKIVIHIIVFVWDTKLLDPHFHDRCHDPNIRHCIQNQSHIPTCQLK